MEEEPVVGAMYEDENGLAFEVLSIDEDDGTIEVQYENGEVSEIDVDAWYEMELQPLQAGAWKEGDEDEEEEEVEQKDAKRPPRAQEDEDDDLGDYDEDEEDY
jgi:hypothetical protein